jgi:aspartyl-tRNA(Asn)/glutamyl-tRNA(Gln) amidotransferase subunit C
LSKYTINKELVQRIAKASRLELTEEELEKYVSQMNDILDSFKEIDQVDTEGVEPSFHPMKYENVLREDKPKKWGWDPLKNTEHKEGEYVKGPKIL